MALTDYLTPDTAAILARWRRLPYPQRLVAAWVDIHQTDLMLPLGEVVDIVNAAHGTRYRVQRLMDWRNGAVDPPRAIADWMRAEVLAYLLGEAAADNIVELLGL